MTPSSFTEWVRVAADCVALILGAALIVWSFLGSDPPSPLLVGAGLTLLYGGHRSVKKLIQNGDSEEKEE